LITKPEPIDVDLRKSALVIVDMQNAFASKKGMLDIAGADLSGAPQVVNVIGRVLSAARRCGMPVVYLQMGYKADLSDSGGPQSPNWHKELGIRMMNCAIVDELAPQPGDIVIIKTRYSGFSRTALDAELQARGIRYLFFTGIATNVCVESTLRDAFFLDYWPILITDATMAAGPPGMQEATLFNIESYFGWTLPSEEFLAGI
jgi:ureidoacrylate peracid hydrolase